MANTKWTSDNPKEFKAGDIICNMWHQNFKRLVLYVTDDALWVIGLVHCALTEGEDKHPIYPIYFSELEYIEPLLRLGNLTDFSDFMVRVQSEVENLINTERITDEK